MLTYEGTFINDALQREVIRDVLRPTGNADEQLSHLVRVRHGRNRQGQLLHYYFNYSGTEQSVNYFYNDGSDLLTGNRVMRRQMLELKPWDLAIVAEP